MENPVTNVTVNIYGSGELANPRSSYNSLIISTLCISCCLIIIIIMLSLEYNYAVKTEAQSSMNYVATVDSERCDKYKLTTAHYFKNCVT